MRELADEGAAILLASHLLHQVQQVCDRVGIFVAASLLPAARRTSSRLRPLAARSRSRWSPRFRRRGAQGDPDGQWRHQGRVGQARPQDARGRTASDLRAELARALVDAGHPPYHLRRRGDELDEIYRRYFQANEPAERGMTAQADSLPVAPSGARTPARPPEAPAPRAQESAPATVPGPGIRAGWRVIAAKEFADEITSLRFLC